MKEYIFEITSIDENKETKEAIIAEILEKAEEKLEREHSIFNSNATYELHEVKEK